NELISFKSDKSVPISPVHDRYKSGEGYHAVPPPYTGTFMPSKLDLVFHDASTVSETVLTVFHVKPSTTKPNKDLTPVKPVDHPTSAENLKKAIPKSRGHRHSSNRKAGFVCKSVNHLIRDYDYYEKKMVQKPIWNHAMRVNHQNSARMTHPYSKKHVVPIAVLTRNISYLSDFKEINRGHVAFGGNPKSGKITCKGIKREFSVARTPQQNGVSERKNMTLIKAARTMLVDSLLPIPFWADAVNTAWSGPTWLFDINTLTQSMNYQTVVAGNQPNHNAGIQKNFNVGKVVQKAESTQQYMLLPLWSTSFKDPQNTDATFDVKENVFAVHVSPILTGLILPVHQLLNFKISGKSSFVDPSQYPDDSDMPALEDIIYLDAEEDVGVEADFSNLKTSITKEGIDYEEVLALLVRIEAIRLFLAYASFMGFMVYQMDVKSAFLYGTIKEEVYVCQPPRFKDPDYPDKVYKVVKALYELHQAPRACYKTLANYLLENGFQRGKID
nr:putative ribonuclease H-like domain-containing protein [Tanacetum cinerariifolium]